MLEQGFDPENLDRKLIALTTELPKNSSYELTRRREKHRDITIFVKHMNDMDL